MSRIRISLWNLLEKVILYMLKISTKFGVAPQSFCENQNSVQNQDQDQDHDITLDFNTRPTFHTYKTPTKFCLDPLTPSKVIVSTWKVHVRTYIQTSRQTEIFLGLFCLLRHTNHEHLSKGENFFFHSCDCNTFSFYRLRMWWISKKVRQPSLPTLFNPLLHTLSLRDPSTFDRSEFRQKRSVFKRIFSKTRHQ